MTLRLGLAAALGLLLAGCGTPPLRTAVPVLAAGERIPSAFASVEVLEVSLPEYANEDAVFVQGEGGAIAPLAGTRWADRPSRAFTLDLTQALAELTGATVAPARWPFDTPPEAQVDVRLAEAVADLVRGEYVLRGQTFVAARDGSGRDRSRAFRVAVPLPPEGGVNAIAAARAQATVLLAREIAATGLR
ncbi:membrane integrity-associated transporter subunit PqiC [Rubellimicrobium sp. CFH 75288]|uniref:PqiC family protein n=1 Tax=Rubellimicrobium sp. CFH 75288 TaxID=2697034 RepID=UPI00141342F7|nr:ABC-type transport auxiliary lipoprotein family protein [Rubellimicrobium sp. CFH 75288]NAZ35439.1 hypothetical protein [Rubellimicrobium sp. CFH 75288]